MSRHRDAPVRPRYGRIVTVLSSAAVTLIAVLGGTGGLSSAASDSRAAPVVPAQAAAAPTSQELLAPTRRLGDLAQRRRPGHLGGPTRPHP